MGTAPGPWRTRFLGLGALLAGNVALACGPWLVRLADTGPVSAGFWRVALALPFLILIAAMRGERLQGLSRKGLLAVLAGGVFFGLDIAAWHIGIGDTRLANAVLFGNSGSVILMVWGFVILRRLPRGREWPAILAALGGAGILLGRSLEIAPANFTGDLFCLLAGLLYAGYLILLQDARKTLGSWSLLALSTSASVAVLLVAAQVLGEPFWPTDWGPVVMLAISSQLVGQGLLVYALKLFEPLAIGIALLTQPAVAALIGWVIFGEWLVPLDILGIVLVGSALVLARVTAPRAPPRPRVNPV
ncbi:DMT family transporter [Aurantiacibacter poecillastricola]|uniref:DMT family transporter n=1 Tax=Aurantiacibacter poecillastricola TaxID=3064385 RepID=UPI00273F0F16|nr:DMT family transporter [Aurantiacibacter sp. 219JJ12-13]MDP5261198.1 DMT family transporter [Aurantiacibacter sp. 219JJ12-13]